MQNNGLSLDAQNEQPLYDLHENDGHVNQQELQVDNESIICLHADNIDDGNSWFQRICDNNQQSNTSNNTSRNGSSNEQQDDNVSDSDEQESSSVSNFSEDLENFELDCEKESAEDVNELEIDIKDHRLNQDVNQVNRDIVITLEITNKVLFSNVKKIELQWRQVLYKGCDLTKEESALIMISIALRHYFTDAALQSLIQTIDCHAHVAGQNIYFLNPCRSILIVYITFVQNVYLF